MKTPFRQLDTTRRSFQSQEFDSALRSKIAGQEEGIRALVDLYQMLCWDVPSGTSGGQPAVPGADRVGEDAHCGSRSGNTVRRPAGSDQGGLRRVSALARDC